MGTGTTYTYSDRRGLSVIKTGFKHVGFFQMCCCHGNKNEIFSQSHLTDLILGIISSVLPEYLHTMPV